MMHTHNGIHTSNPYTVEHVFKQLPLGTMLEWLGVEVVYISGMR